MNSTPTPTPNSNPGQSTQSSGRSPRQSGRSPHATVITAQPRGAVAWAAEPDSDLRRLVVRQRRPLIVLGRSASGPLNAARDARWAVTSLTRTAGVDASTVLPTDRDLADMLLAHGRGATAAGSAKFMGRFLLIDLVSSGIVVCLSEGPADGTPSDVPTKRLPTHADLLTRFLRRTGPAGVFATRPDRFSRSLHGITPLYNELSRLHRAGGAWAGDGTTGRWRLDDPIAPHLLAMYVAERAFEARRNAVRRAARRGDR